jgi:drug/metabolite transporter (DMT)-like permease
MRQRLSAHGDCPMIAPPAGAPPMSARSAPPKARADRVPLGIFYMLGATLLFAGSFAISKWQVATYSFAEVLFFRAVGSLVICAALILPRKGFGVFRTRRLAAHVGRNAAQGTAQSLFVLALALMPLAGVVAINFSAPIFAALAAALFLHERIGRARGFALVTGFAGVLLVASPGADSFSIGAIFAIVNAVMYGSVTAAVRGLTATESPETLTMYQMVLLTLLFAAAMAIFGFTTPTASALGPLLINGALNGTGQYLWTRSLSQAPPAAVGPFYYFSLVWAMILGFVFWGDVQTPLLLLGSAVVVGSGLFLLWHERGRQAPPEPD